MPSAKLEQYSAVVPWTSPLSGPKDNTDIQTKINGKQFFYKKFWKDTFQYYLIIRTVIP